ACDGCDEVEVLDLADEGDGVAGLLAAEAEVEAEGGVDGERRGLLLVERAESHPSLTDSLEGDVVGRDRDEVRGLPDSRDVLVEDAHRGSGYGAGRRRRGAQTPRGGGAGRPPGGAARGGDAPGGGAPR